MNYSYRTYIRPSLVRVAKKMGVRPRGKPKTPPATTAPTSKPGPAVPAAPAPTPRATTGIKTKSKVPEIILEEANAAAIEFKELNDDALLRSADAYRQLGRHGKAILCYELLLEREEKNVWIQTLADIYLACGQTEKAWETLLRLDPAGLTDRGLRIYTQSYYAILRAQGKLQEAYDYLRKMDEVDAATSPGVQIKLAEAERHLGCYDYAFERLKAGLSTHSNNITYMLQYAGCAGELNQSGEALNMVSMLHKTQKPTHSITLRYLQLLWQAGDMTAFYEVLDKALGQKMSEPGLLKFAREIGYVDARVAEYCTAIADVIRDDAAKAAPVAQATFARRFLSLDLFEEARDAATLYLDKYRKRADAFYVRGAAHFYLDDNEAAASDLLRCVELNPGQFEAYSLLMHLLPRKPGGIDTFVELLERRDAAHPKYTTRGEDGRLGLLDIERSQSSFMIGDFNKGQRIKQERPVCRFLEYTFPEQYNCFKEPGFSQTKKDSILIISDDGVGDEIRWAQFYPELRKHFHRIEAMCEPRSLTLLQRSFPDITFHPHKRRMMEAPGDGRERKSAWVPYFALARLINDRIYDRLSEFSEIRLTPDFVLGAWDKLPQKQPPLNGAKTGSYIKPDPRRQDHWRAHFDEVAGPKMKVGLLWRSSLRTPRRSKHYMDLDDLLPILNVRGVHFVSLQHEHTRDEILFCRAFGIEILEDADLYDDFEAVAAVTANLDLIIGANSFPAELGAAVGTPCWQLGLFSTAVRIRLGESQGETDRLSWNTTIIRVDQEDGFDGNLQDMAARVTKVAQSRLRDLVTSRKVKALEILPTFLEDGAKADVVDKA